MEDYDAVSTGIMWDRLIAITNEIVGTLVRTSFSTIVRESYDLSCVLFDGDARLIAQGSYSAPSFIGTSQATILQMLSKFPPHTLLPGDVIATNDPWIGTGHLYDVNMLRPVFVGQEIVGYTLSITHLPDIGGIGFSATAKTIFEEGLRLPVCKIVKAGQVNAELLELIATNVRVPDQVLGDLYANIACNEVGGRLLVDFMEEYGISDLRPIADAIIGNSERVLRDRIRELPDGTFRNSFQIEGWDAPIRLATQIEIAGDQVSVDFSGTGSVVERGINVPFTYTRAFALYAIKCLTIPNIPNNTGCVLPISVSAPEGCILNALPPYPTGGRNIVGHYVLSLMYGALEDALPERVQAESGMLTMLNVQGHSRGRQVSSIYFVSGGYGALQGTDGAAALPSPTNMTGTPVEFWEEMTGIVIEEKALHLDSAGPGAARGGLGQKIVMVNETGEALTVSCLAGRTEFPAMGYQGGSPGALREIRINDEPVHPKNRYVLDPGDRLELLEPGGGGFGPAFAREPELVLQDVLDGNVSLAAANEGYGVVIDPATMRVAAQETVRRRASMQDAAE